MVYVKDCVFLVVCLLGLLICGVEAGCFKSTSKVWGCPNQSSRLEVSSDPSNKPIWGQSSLMSITFTDYSDFKKYLEKIREILGQVIAESNFNTVDGFRHFYEDARTRNMSNLKEFFQIYRPRFEDITPYEALTVKAFTQIEEKLGPSILFLKESMFLCAGVSNVPKALVKKLNQANFNPSKMPINYFDRVLGGIRFHIRPYYRNLPIHLKPMNLFTIRHEGIILLHPGAGVADPIVVMANGEYPHGEFGPYKEYNKVLLYNFMSDNLDFIWTTHANYGPGTVPNSFTNDQDIVDTVVYVGKAYCSVRDTTSKYGLLDENKVEKKRTSEGSSLAAYKFSILPSAQQTSNAPRNIQRPFFQLISPGRGKDKTYAISFQSLKHPLFQSLKKSSTELSKESNIEIFVTTSEILGYSSSAFLEKLEKISDIVNDDKFLNDVQSIQIPKFKSTNE